MATSGAEFLERLTPRRRPQLPENLTGTIRLDLRDGARTDHWYLTVRDQRVDVSRSPDDADLVVWAEREVFDRLADGRAEALQSLMRNELTLRGEMRLLLILRRVFPGPADARHPRDVARESLRR